MLRDVILAMLFLARVPLSHYWFIPMIVGLYLFIPIIGAALHRLDMKLVLIPSAALALYLFGVPLLAQLLSVAGSDVNVTSILEPGFSGGVYGVYLLSGWGVERTKQLPSVGISGIVTIILFAICVGFQYWCFSLGSSYKIWYNNLLLSLLGIALFVLFARMPNNAIVSRDLRTSQSRVTAFGAIVGPLSYYSFAVYLIHNPICMLLSPLIRDLSLIRPIQVFLLAFSVLMVSMVVAALISRIPNVGKVLLYLK